MKPEPSDIYEMLLDACSDPDGLDLRIQDLEVGECTVNLGWEQVADVTVEVAFSIFEVLRCKGLVTLITPQDLGAPHFVREWTVKDFKAMHWFDVRTGVVDVYVWAIQRCSLPQGERDLSFLMETFRSLDTALELQTHDLFLQSLFQMVDDSIDRVELDAKMTAAVQVDREKKGSESLFSSM